MSLMKILALLQLLTIMNNVSVQAVTLRIQGGSTVHVGDRVNITCTCDFTKCYQGVHFRISGVHHNYSILYSGGVTNYNLDHTTDWNTVNYTLVLVHATVNDNGTTYQCIPSFPEGELEWSNTETLTVLSIAPVGETNILSIAGGDVVKEGSNVTIGCNCRGHGPDIACGDYPTFEINHIPHSGGGIARGRYPGYSIVYNYFTQVHKLIAHNVSRSQNGSTYRCGLRDHYGEVILWSNTVTMIVTGSSQIEMSLNPQPALIGEDVQIRCTLVQIPVQPRIAVNDEEEPLQSLANRDKYTLTSSTNTNGVAVYVLTLHNVSVSDNGTRFECFVRSPGRRITSGTRVLRVGYKVILMTTTTTTTKSEDIIASSSENPTFPLRTINSYEWPIPTTTTTTTTTTTATKRNFATPITKPTATPVQPKPATTGGPIASQLIWITLDPQPAVIGEDVQIRCTHNISSVINYHPWIVVDGETTTLNTLTSQENYSLNKSALIDGQVVYVVIMHNVRASDNGTRFECYFRLNGGEEIRSGTVALRVRHEATKQPSLIKISLGPQPALIGEDVQIRCTLVQIPVLPRIAVNDKEETLQSLADRDRYTLTSSTITNGVAVYVLTLHNVSVSDNGTRFECFLRSSGGKQTSATVTLNIRYKGGPGTITTAPTIVKGSLYTTDPSEIVSTHVQTLEQSTFCVSPTILVAPVTSTVELYAILIPVGVLVALVVISLLIIMIMALVLVKRRQHEQDMKGDGVGEILEERKENIYVL